MERIMGVEPTCSAWEADILPMNYIRIITIEHMCHPTRYTFYYTIPQLINQVFFIIRLKFLLRCKVIWPIFFKKEENEAVKNSQKKRLQTYP